MPIEKAIYPNGPDLPQGQPAQEAVLDLEDAGITPPEEGDIEITDLEDGGALVDFAPADEEEAPRDENFFANLAEVMNLGELDDLGAELINLVDKDIESQKEWREIYAEGMKLLGFRWKDSENEIFDGSCTATHPVLAEAIVKYQAKARNQLLPPTGPVRTEIIGIEDDEKKGQAQRVADHMNYQVMHQMAEYRVEHDRMLFHQAFGGSAFTKTYYDSAMGRPVSRFVSLPDFIINYYATDLGSAHRYSEVVNLSGNELRRSQLNGFYLKEELNSKAATNDHDPIVEEIDDISGRKIPAPTEDEIHIFYEIHTYLAIDDPDVDDRTEEEREIGLELPYIVTVDKDSHRIMSIRRNWRAEDPQKTKRVWYTHWPFIPGFGFLGYGYVHLIGGLARTATAALRNLVDAGNFANLPAGFKAHGLRVVGSNEPLQPGEWREVNAPGLDLTKSLVPLPYKEPSKTLFDLLGFVTQAAQQFASASDAVVSQSTNYGPVGTTLALLEESSKLFSAIHERLFESQKHELGILAQINHEFLPQEYPYDSNKGQASIMAQDYDGRIDVIPVTDPRTPTQAHRVAHANATLAIAQQFPKEHNVRAVLADLHRELGQDHPEKYLNPPPPQAVPTDPVTENQAILLGKPVKAAEYQDHLAHIGVHVVIAENPQYNNNPQVVMATMAHIQEHLAQQFRLEIQREMGQQIPPPQPGQPPNPQVENAIAQSAAEAATKIKEGAEANAENDPIIALQEAELVLREREIELQRYTADMEDRRKRAEADQTDDFKRDEMALDHQEALAKMHNDIEKARISAEAARKRAAASHN